MPHAITFNPNTSYALREQNIWKSDYEFPFSCNPNIGCLYACKYCYLQQHFFSRQAEFGREVKVKTGIVRALGHDLNKYRDIPQHLKRVQVANATEMFHPIVLRKIQQDIGTDINTALLETFQRHWTNGNKWMVHIVTKSHLIIRYLDILRAMRHQVQVELTIVSPDEEVSRRVEPMAPSVTKRLNVIERLSREGIFVRVMAMPWMHEEREAMAFRNQVVNLGARGFKHKDLNYFDKAEMINGNTRIVKRRADRIFDAVLLNSGEHADGREIRVPMPQQKDKPVDQKRPGGWKRAGAHGDYDFQEKIMPILRSGYAELNDVDWGYLI